MKAVKSIIIVSRTWRDRINGNTYFKAKAYMNGGETVFQIATQPGNGGQIEDEVVAELGRQGIIPIMESADNGCKEGLYHYYQRTGIRMTAVPPAPVTSKKLLNW